MADEEKKFVEYPKQVHEIDKEKKKVIRSGVVNNKAEEDAFYKNKKDWDDKK